MAEHLDWRARAQSFEFLAASRTSAFTWTGTGAARRLAGRRVTSEFFPALGVQPTVGRTFAARDDLAGAEPVAIVTEAFWRSELGSDPAALGRPLTLDGRAFTIVGILPSGFHYLRDYDVFVATGPFAGDKSLLERGNHAGYFALGRLKAGVTLDAAVGEMRSIERQLSQQYPDTNAGISVSVEPLSSRIVTDVRQTLLVLLGAVGLLLLIACVNVSNLLVARGAARQHELAVRAALGGGRARLAVQLLTESTLLSAAGGLLGVLLAAGLLRALIAVAPEGTPRLDEVRLDAATLWFAVAAVTVCGLLFGAFPAAQASSVSGQQALTRTRGGRVPLDRIGCVAVSWSRKWRCAGAPHRGGTDDAPCASEHPRPGLPADTS